MTAIKPTRPLLRYHGGKWILAPWIIGHFPEHKIYTETFGGAASVLLRKKRSYSEVYNDLCGELCNLFTVTRESGGELREALRLTPFARNEFELSYEISSDKFEQARRTIVRSFMGFGSNSHNRKTGFRSNSNRSGTTPAHDWKNFPDCLDATISRLSGVVIENRDAVDIIKQHDSRETLHYVDPPYVHETRDAGLDYRHEMSNDDHEKLFTVLSDCSGMVVLSGYPCELYDNDLYCDWHRVEKKSFADGARSRVEVLWINDAAWLKLSKPKPQGLFP